MWGGGVGRQVRGGEGCRGEERAGAGRWVLEETETGVRSVCMCGVWTYSREEAGGRPGGGDRGGGGGQKDRRGGEG